MTFIPPIVSIDVLAKAIAANGHGDRDSLSAWLVAEATREAFHIHDTANGTEEPWCISLVEVERVRPFLIKAMGFDPLATAPITPAPALEPIASSPAKPQQRGRAQDEEILSAARNAGYKPAAPPPQTAPDPARRLARLREMGGNAKYKRGEWEITGIVALTGVEKNEGRKRADQKTIRADIKEAAQSELDAKRAGPFDGAGAR